MKKPSTPSKASAVSRGDDSSTRNNPPPFSTTIHLPVELGGMPPCGSDGSLPSRPQWTALFDLFDIVLSVFECMCIFSFYFYFLLSKKNKIKNHVA